MMALHRSPESFFPKMNLYSFGSNLWPPWSGQFWSQGASYEWNWQFLPVSEKTNFEVDLLCSYVQTCDLRVGVSFDPKGIIRIKLIKVHKEMLNIKALILPVSEKKNFEVGFLCSYVPTCDPHGRGQFWPQKHHMNKLGRGPQGDAKNQISKLYAFQFQKRRILKTWFFVPMFQLMTPWVGPISTPGASSKETW